MAALIMVNESVAIILSQVFPDGMVSHAEFDKRTFTVLDNHGLGGRSSVGNLSTKGAGSFRVYITK